MRERVPTLRKGSMLVACVVRSFRQVVPVPAQRSWDLRDQSRREMALIAANYLHQDYGLLTK